MLLYYVCTEHVDLMHGVCGHCFSSATPSALTALTLDSRDGSIITSAHGTHSKAPGCMAALWEGGDWIAFSRLCGDLTAAGDY